MKYRFNSRAITPERCRGFSLIEILVVLVICGIIAGMAIPTLLSLVQSFRTGGDARNLSGDISVAKMRASADYTRARVYVDLTARSFQVERWDFATTTWIAEGGTQFLSKGVDFGFGSVTTPPSGAGAIAQAPLCYSDATPTVTIASTACVVFNSRGVPVNSSGVPIGTDDLYIADQTSVYGITVLATGLVRTLRSEATGNNWSAH